MAENTPEKPQQQDDVETRTHSSPSMDTVLFQPDPQVTKTKIPQVPSKAIVQLIHLEQHEAAKTLF